jgi:hypothetical protein
MKKGLSLPAILLFYHLSSPLKGQIVDDFSDGDFWNNPRWFGDSIYFQVNAQFQLQSNGPSATDTLTLVTESPYAKGVEWNFWIRLDFSPSTQNYARVYLISDTANLQGPVNGYFVQIGGITGSNDAIDLYRQDGTNLTKIISGIPGHAGKATNTLRIKILRDTTGYWEIYADTLGGVNFLLEGTGVDNTYSQSRYFGVFCQHTSTRANLFYFDEFYIGPPRVDTIPPVIDSLRVIDSLILYIRFNEPMDTNTVKTPTAYSVQPSIGVATHVVIMSSSEALLHFSTPFQNGTTYTLFYNGIQDQSGNVGSGQIQFTYWKPEPASYRDVVINEIFPDPSPPVGLPQKEFIELFNRSQKVIDLGGWKIKDPSTTATLPSYLLKPGEYVILCASSDVPEFLFWGPTLGVSSFPTLNNSGDSLWLLRDDGLLIDFVAYSLSWYKDPNKDDGGWTLELIDPWSDCPRESVWAASISPYGGTPGTQNSLFLTSIDTIAPDFGLVLPISNQMLIVQFSEPIDSSLLMDPANYHILQYQGSFTSQVVSDQEVHFFFSPPLDSNVFYILQIDTVRDCSGNEKTQLQYGFALTYPAEPGDLILNEVLTYPLSGHKRYVEIYNRSDKILNFQGFHLGRGIDTVVQIRKVISSPYYLLPKTILCLTDDTMDVKAVYHPPLHARFLQTEERIPAYDANEDGIWLIAPGFIPIDYFHYLDDYHFPDLKDKRGVSLERICYFCETNVGAHWQSAAATVFYGTPGYTNSQYNEGKQKKDGWFHLEPETFSPDQDGYNDYVLIHYQLPEAGKIQIRVRDRMGRLVKTVTEATLVGTEPGFFKWDGTNENGESVHIGPYFIEIQVNFPQSGKVTQELLPCIVAKRF